MFVGTFVIFGILWDTTMEQNKSSIFLHTDNSDKFFLGLRTIKRRLKVLVVVEAFAEN